MSEADFEKWSVEIYPWGYDSPLQKSIALRAWLAAEEVATQSQSSDVVGKLAEALKNAITIIEDHADSHSTTFHRQALAEYDKFLAGGGE